MVFNDTKVIPARLHGLRFGRGDTTPAIEATLHMRLEGARWKAFAKPGRKLQQGDTIDFKGLVATVEAKGEGGELTLAFDCHPADLDARIVAVGEMPLPPYIAAKRAVDAQDYSDYQTIYANEAGAVAAPTAGLHFTPELLAKLDENGIERLNVTLHVGAGTFLPVKVENVADHKMHAEWGHLPQSACDKLNAARAAGRRIVAVGTTSLRLLESAADEQGVFKPFARETSIFITPGYQFKGVDALMTNFHLPKSTLFMLVSAFCGLKRMQSAYAHAIENGYRFYSYGDSSLLERAK
jgi:S-adenosylmethionine:tRNA ribosyltransferase-isomerase